MTSELSLIYLKLETKKENEQKTPPASPLQELHLLKGWKYFRSMKYILSPVKAMVLAICCRTRTVKMLLVMKRQLSGY